MTETYLRRLDSFARLPPDEACALKAALERVRRVAAREDIVAQGERPDHVNVLLNGFVRRHKLLPNGRRQTSAVYVSGDIFDLRISVFETMDHSLTAMTACSIAFIGREELRRLARAHPAVGDALWASSLVNEAVTAEWLVNIAARPALDRLAHLICELYWRLRAVGEAAGDEISWPFTQAELGEALALSTVSVNRMLSRLRDAGHIRFQRGRLRVLQLAALEKIGGFTPAYLHV